MLIKLASTHFDNVHESPLQSLWHVDAGHSEGKLALVLCVWQEDEGNLHTVISLEYTHQTTSSYTTHASYAKLKLGI